MKRLAVQKVCDLDPNVRAWLSRLLGCGLTDDAEIHIELHQPDPSPAAPRPPDTEMQRILNAMSDLSGPSAAELEAALEEALKSGRPGHGR